MTKRENILARIVTVLNAAPAFGATVYRSRTELLRREEHPAILVEPSRDNPTQANLARLGWELLVSITVVIRSDAKDQDADPIVQEIHSRLMSDTTLDGLVVDIQPGQVEFQFIDADSPLAVVTLQYRINYQTALGSLV